MTSPLPPPPLQANGTLTDVNVSWNQLRAKGVVALAEALGQNSALQVCVWGS